MAPRFRWCCSPWRLPWPLPTPGFSQERGRSLALAPELQAIIKYAVEASNTDMSWKAMDRYSSDLAAIKEAGVEVHRTPDSVLQAQLAAWDAVIAAQSADPFFAKVVESQKAWAKRVVGTQFELEVDQKMAFDHFFPAH